MYLPRHMSVLLLARDRIQACAVYQCMILHTCCYSSSVGSRVSGTFMPRKQGGIGRTGSKHRKVATHDSHRQLKREGDAADGAGCSTALERKRWSARRRLLRQLQRLPLPKRSKCAWLSCR